MLYRFDILSLKLLFRSISKSKMLEMFGYTAIRQLSQMIASVAFFHSSEYVLAVAIHGRSNVTLSSLLISKQYVLAMGCSFLEYFLEILLLPWLKEYWWISNTGLALVLIGEVIRKAAVITADRAFTHMIKVRHEDQHELVTHGIYRFVRHPGYSGFFIWAIGTQIMLCNPICIVTFMLVTWRFFSTRIRYEEYYLRQFFGSQYEEYSRRVPSGLPFIK
ncbi:protein-S-isoprenylcysteine O-methyltransferase A-like [Telopea speciosissima]|uniref:protein-S-isoprenylcysteine O-methyltransferase A-like n=1 Tax=Telopea speciosissima TaxID=54955 RepID=UPI001CC816CB|nr:protein-S-isoprenylcysteine O-methyltransferase A-like [Telopea speciosissima]